MTLTLILPGLLWPDTHDMADITKGLALPALSRLLGRGQWQARPQRPAAQLAATFGLPGLSVAAALAAEAGLETAGRHWLVADPVNLRVDRDRALLGDVGVMNLSHSEAEAMVASLNALFAEDGFVFHAPDPARWFVSLPAASEASFTPLPDVIGEDINHHLPAGPRGMLWSRYLNELQMLLYTHPVNDARELRGELPVNSLWLWGESDAVALRPTLAASQLLADGALWQWLGRQAGAAVDVPPYRFDDLALPAGGNGVVVLDALEAAAQFRDAWGWREGLQRLEQDWFAPLWQALSQRRLQRLDIACAGEHGGVLSITAADAWKFWRRDRALASLGAV